MNHTAATVKTILICPALLYIYIKVPLCVCHSWRDAGQRLKRADQCRVWEKVFWWILSAWPCDPPDLLKKKKSCLSDECYWLAPPQLLPSGPGVVSRRPDLLSDKHTTTHAEFFWQLRNDNNSNLCKKTHIIAHGIVLNIHKVDRTMIKIMRSPNKSNHLPWHQPSQCTWSWTLAEGLLQQSVQGLSSSHQSTFGHRPEWLWWVADASPQSAEFLLVAGRLPAEATPCVRWSQTEGCLKSSSQCRTRPGKAISAGLSLHDRRQVYTTFSELPAGISVECLTKYGNVF